MFKTKLAASFLLAISLSTSALAANNAVEITIGGIGPGVDAAAFKTVQQVIGHAVGNGVLSKFVVSGYGKEGGFSACVQASPFTQKFAAFVQQLQAIKPNKKTTAYSLTWAKTCY